MDITHRFKAGVMTVKLRVKGDQQLPSDKNRILPKSKTPRDEFAKAAADVLQKITTLRNVLLENRAAYMRVGQHLKNAAQMSDEQRDLIDRESEKFVIYYTQYLAQMRADWKSAKRKTPQQRAHIEAVLELLTNYLRSVQFIYQEQKKYRVQHELETYRLLKLAADKKKIPVCPAGSRLLNKSETLTKDKQNNEHEGTEFIERNCSSASEESNEIELLGDWQLESSEPDLSVHSTKTKQITDKTNDLLDTTNASSDAARDALNKSQASQKFALDEYIEKSQQQQAEEVTRAKALTAEDLQLFEQENVELYHELQGLSEEVEQIEKNVVDIAQLQDMFTEKVSMQQHNIERIANLVVGATENVKDANEQLRQAIQNSAGLRVWSLFFLLVMSFTLLFLDWFYD